MRGPPSPSVNFIRLLLLLLLLPLLVILLPTPLAAIALVAGSAPPLLLASALVLCLSMSSLENDADMDDRFFAADDDLPSAK